MRPHQAAEEMLKFAAASSKPLFGDKTKDEYWSIFQKACSSAVTFDFGDLVPDIKHVNFAAEATASGISLLPYPSSAFCGRDWMCVIIDAVKENRSLAVGAFVRRGGRTVPHSVVFIKFDSPDNLHSDGKLKCSIQALSFIKGDNNSLAGRELIISDDEIHSVADAVLGYMSMLSSRDVLRKTEPPPHALNKKRKQRGRPQINEINYVSIRRQSTERSEQAGGTHASPRPHWRRGHIRRILSSTGPRVIPIAPMLVGLNDDVRWVLPKEYRVKESSTPPLSK